MRIKNYERFLSQIDLPFLETDDNVLAEIFRLLERKLRLQRSSKQSFIDLGSGNGKVVIYSAQNYGIRSIGIEIDPNLVKETKGTIKSLKQEKKLSRKNLRKIKIYNGDFYTYDLTNHNYVYLYSLPTMQKYLKHVITTAKIGTIFISHLYPLKIFNQILELELKLDHNIYVPNKEISTYFYRRI